MKRFLVLIVPFFFFLQSAYAQSGDLELNLQKRSYIKINADSSLKGNDVKRFLIGKNYRNEWTESIRVPILKFQSDFGGLKPEKEGGGKQTHTLHLKDAGGREWNLRSVRKFPENVIASEMKGTVVESLVSDGISGSYPYSVLSVGTIAKAVGVPYLPNTVVYIPDDPALGEFRSKYKNTLALLELRSPENKDAKTLDTEEIIPELLKSFEKTVDQKAVLRARLLDNFIMDFDRHEGQWIWQENDSGQRKIYHPIPKDRDQAFFKAEGFLPRKLSKTPSLGQIQGLSVRPKNILTYNYAGRNFDRTFLTALDEAAWNNEIDSFLKSVTDQVIEDALTKQPSEIQKYEAQKIIDILKKKRNWFKEDLMHYYRFISKKVSVLGTNDANIFTIKKNATGAVDITVQNSGDSIINYKRSFDPAVTREICIYGLEGNDQFLINGEHSPIKIRLIGGPGEDVYTNNAGGKKVLVYDVTFETNELNGGSFKNRISRDPLNNEYRRIHDEYNSSSIGLKPEYARDGGLFLGLRYTATTTGFRKEPYATKQNIYITRALSASAWHLHYDADFIKVGRSTDLLFRSDAKLPTVRTHFFGYGNNTDFNKNLKSDYYRIFYTMINASLMARHSWTPWFHLAYGPFLQYFKIQPEKNEDHYINSYSSSDNTYQGKWYTGGEVRATINTRNNELIPTRGIYFNTYVRRNAGISTNAKNFSQIGSEFSFYTDFLLKDHIVLASSFGAHRNFEGFEVPQAQYLGFKQNLRGYRYQRFAGRARAYNNTELRINFGDANFYLFKGPLGVVAFNDVGRVWVNEDNSDTWHTGYGGGIWLAPFKKLVVTGMLTFSREEKGFPMVIFGFQF